MRRLFTFVMMTFLFVGLSLTVYGEEAGNISAMSFISGNDGEECWLLTDGMESEAVYIRSGLTLRNEGGIGSVYLVFDFPCEFAVQDLDTGRTVLQRDEGFLHVFCDLENRFGYVPNNICIQFPESAWVAELQLFSSGTVPATVQQWQQPLNGSADIVLFSTHGDDEQLYFAGMLPYYAGERGLNVQVVYMTGHSNLSGSVRQHEMLNGLWAVGVKAYPVFGPFPDFKLLNREATYVEYENLGFSREELLSFVVENLRRFRPLVAVGHDLDGEYGHGMHMVYADLLTQAVEVSADPEAFPEWTAQYGVWDVPKTYLHLYPENKIVMDWDQPLQSFDGMTAFEVTQKYGFPCHITQQYDLYVHWLYGGDITMASQIQKWSPCKYGLYRTTVGEDLAQNDFMENLTPYDEIFRQEALKDQQLRDAVSLARTQQAKEPPLLRSAEEPQQVSSAEHPSFPVFAMLLSMLSAAGIVLMLLSMKKFEKKQK